MPIKLTPDGQEIWRDKIPPSPTVGNKTTQRLDLEHRRPMVVANTARVIREFKLPPEELEDIIEINAQNVEMEPDKLRQLAEEYNKQLQEREQERIEKE